MNFATVIIPCYNEKQNITRLINDQIKLYGASIDIIVVVDSIEDKTIGAFNSILNKPNTYKLVIQGYGQGPANAIKFGIDMASTECVVVMMADGSDDPIDVIGLTNLVSRGVAVACASRYMSGGQQIGGPRLKRFLSRVAGKMLYIFAGVGTHDATNSFKAYSRALLKQIKIESTTGFELGLELVSKAHRLGLPIAEIPTIWLDRTQGNSRFMLAKMAPRYIPWFLNCFGPKLKNKIK